MSTLTRGSARGSIAIDVSPRGRISSTRQKSPKLPGYTRPPMSKVCHVCRKGPAFGHSRSHSMVATKRRFDPNLQRVRIDDHGTPRRVYVCTRCLKAGKVVKAP
jgi:large subunit ribosomal protein L28